ncbi:hypothetical protein NST54_01370 [Caldifermentibacillus hisashii]|uniref:hypothetical protein n=1 Tax=Caldifermentibacillus hisashii TaxID=996558 RepID=UPI0034D63AE8
MKPRLGHLNDRYDRSLVEPIVQYDSNGQYKPVNRKTVQYKAPRPLKNYLNKFTNTIYSMIKRKYTSIYGG